MSLLVSRSLSSQGTLVVSTASRGARATSSLRPRMTSRSSSRTPLTVNKSQRSKGTLKESTASRGARMGAYWLLPLLIRPGSSGTPLQKRRFQLSEGPLVRWPRMRRSCSACLAQRPSRRSTRWPRLGGKPACPRLFPSRCNPRAVSTPETRLSMPIESYQARLGFRGGSAGFALKRQSDDDVRPKMRRRCSTCGHSRVILFHSSSGHSRVVLPSFLRVAV